MFAAFWRTLIPKSGLVSRQFQAIFPPKNVASAGRRNIQIHQRMQKEDTIRDNCVEFGAIMGTLVFCADLSEGKYDQHLQAKKYKILLWEAVWSTAKFALLGYYYQWTVPLFVVCASIREGLMVYREYQIDEKSGIELKAEQRELKVVQTQHSWR